MQAGHNGTQIVVISHVILPLLQYGVYCWQCKLLMMIRNILIFMSRTKITAPLQFTCKKYWNTWSVRIVSTMRNLVDGSIVIFFRNDKDGACIRIVTLWRDPARCLQATASSRLTWFVWHLGHNNVSIFRRDRRVSGMRMPSHSA